MRGIDGGRGVHAWRCECGAHRIMDGQRAARVGLEAHLAGCAHRRGEYFYGCQGQRTVVRVAADQDGRFIHRLEPG
jgi:hypothetical protein